MKLYLAPLHGVTDWVFRKLFTEEIGGVDCAVSPFVTTVSAPSVARSHLRDVLPERNTALPIVPQMIGNKPDELLTLARALEELGYTEVNWNLGCPFAKVTRKQRGSGLLPHPDRIVQVIEFLAPRMKARLSLKTRLGLTSATELLDLLPRLERFPLAGITIHPRIGAQLYAGEVDLERFGEALDRTSHPVVYNGDLFTTTQFLAVSHRFGSRLAGYMLGRGVVRNPLLPAELRGALPGKLGGMTPVQKVRELHNKIYAASEELLSGPSPLLGRMKEIWKYLSLSFDGGPKLLKQVCKARSKDAYRWTVDGFFDSNPSWQPDKPVFPAF